MTVQRPKRKRKFIVPRGFARGAPPPPATGSTRWRFVAAIAAAIFVHAGLLGLATRTSDEVLPPPARTLPTIVATRPAPPPPPPPPAPLPDQPQHRSVRRPQAPAQAAKVISQAPAPDAPADLTDFVLATGTAETFAGGETSAHGTSKKAVEGRAVPVGEPNRRDLSRPAAPARAEWSCAWPEDEVETDLRETRVVIRVAVDADGEPQNVETVSAPKAEFATAATQCALSERYVSALDAAGHRIPAKTNPLVVHFVR